MAIGQVHSVSKERFSPVNAVYNAGDAQSLPTRSCLLRAYIGACPVPFVLYATFDGQKTGKSWYLHGFFLVCSPTSGTAM